MKSLLIIIAVASACLSGMASPPQQMLIAKSAAAASSNWWEAGGATGTVAAYQAKSSTDRTVANFAASKVNLANPGTHDATDGSAPSWSSGAGWSFNGSTYLVTDIQPTDGTWSVLMQVNDISGSQLMLFGVFNGSSNDFIVQADFSSQVYYGNGSGVATAPAFASPGNIGFAGLTALRNGASDGTISGGGYSPVAQGIYIGGANNGGGMAFGATYKCTAFAIWNNTLTSGQYTAVAAAMAGL